MIGNSPQRIEEAFSAAHRIFASNTAEAAKKLESKLALHDEQRASWIFAREICIFVERIEALVKGVLGLEIDGDELLDNLLLADKALGERANTARLRNSVQCRSFIAELLDIPELKAG